MSAAPPFERSASRRILPIAAIAAVLLLVPAGLANASGPNGTLRGYITNHATSGAIAGATVTITAGDVDWVFQATTSVSGFYSISLPNHQYTVQVSSPAYDMNSTTVIVGSREAVWNNMSLNPASPRTAIVQGFVKDSVSSAAVTTGQIVAMTWWLGSEQYANASTMNATGFYQLHLVPGTYQLATQGVVGYAPYTSSYIYPAGGSTLWENLSLTPTPLIAWINGTVQDGSSYATIAGANVTAYVGSLALAPAQSNATGRFSIHVPSGTIRLTGDAAGHAPASTSVTVYSASAYSVAIYLMPLSATERGWVRNGVTGAPIPNAVVTATPFWSSGYTDQATTDATGAFQLNLTPDDFDLSATATGYTSWTSYAFLSAGLVIWNNVSLWPITCPVQGYVLDGTTGAHLSGMYVYAYDGRSGYSTYGVSDSTGFYRFLFPPSPAVTLRVYGSSPYAGALVYPDVRPYETTWVNITLPRLDAALDVTVTNASSGLPIPNAYVDAFWANGYNYGITDATGFTAVGVPSGLPLTVGVGASGYLTVYVSMDAATGTATLSVSLNPVMPYNVTVRGYVRDGSTLAGISGALVQATGYNGSSPLTLTNATGYYTFMIVPQPQTIEATDYGHDRGAVSVSPTAATTLWINLTLPADTTAPLILNFTANPDTNVGPGNPTRLHATVNETSLASTDLSILKLWSSAGGVGSFLTMGTIPATDVAVTPTTRGNSSVSSRYSTQTPVTTLSDGTNRSWWPDVSVFSPYQDYVTGTFQNATMASPMYANAVFDTRSGRLLYVYANPNYIDPMDQPAARFTPTALGLQVNLASAAILGYATVTGPSFRIGTLSLAMSKMLSSGEYAALLQAYDAGSNAAEAATFFNVTADTTPPVARAGPNQTVNQGTLVTLDGSGSTDNIAVTGYTWTFTDGTPQVLLGAIVNHRFMNAGVYLVTLTVIDAAGNAGASTMTVTVLDTTPPTVTITTPSPGASVSGAIGIGATATDNVGVVRVEFLMDGVMIANLSNGPYTATFNTTALSNGNHTLEAIAYDAAGNAGSASERLSVYNAPQPGSGALLGLDSTIWLLLILAVLAAAGIAVVILLSRRRKSPPAVALPPPPPPPPPMGGMGPPGP